jgi:hypothetical protein
MHAVCLVLDTVHCISYTVLLYQQRGLLLQAAVHVRLSHAATLQPVAAACHLCYVAHLLRVAVYNVAAVAQVLLPVLLLRHSLLAAQVRTRSYSDLLLEV